MHPLLYVLSGRGGSVNVNGDNAVVVGFAIGYTVSKLPLYGLFPLPLRREAKVENYINDPFIESCRIISKLVNFQLGEHGKVNREFQLRVLSSHIFTTLSCLSFSLRIRFFFYGSVKFIHSGLNDPKLTIHIAERKIVK